jgi:uncharacterized membrane protein
MAKASKGGIFMRSSKHSQIFITLFILALAACLIGSPSLLAAEEKEKDERPPRLIAMAPEYPGVVVPPGEDVEMDLILYNKGKADENVEVKVTSIPKGWKARVKTYKFTVTGAHVENGESTRLTFFAEPEKKKDIKPGKYTFKVEARTLDRAFTSKQSILVTVSEEAEKEKEKAVTVTTSYPVLRGPSDATFEFSIEAGNKLDKDVVYNLTSKGPENWEVNFKPAYEDKFISSLRLEKNGSKSMAVEVKPHRLAEAGEYPINVRIGSADAKAEAKLTVILTGTYKLEAGTPTGILSLEAQQGKPANMSFYVRNTGSAINRNIKFVSIKPENWKVEFEPEKIDALKADELNQVEVTITPADEALVGDYSVGINVDGEKDQKTMEMRVTVKASTAWGWIGIGIIVGVIAGLGGLFTWLGRR